MENEYLNDPLIVAIREQINGATTRRGIAKHLCRTFFKDSYGNPFDITDGQADIFLAIFLREHLLWQIITYTQYGKSDTVSMAVILRAIAFREDWTIVSGTEKLAHVIMDKVIGHMFDHELIESQIDPSMIDKTERLKHKRTTNHLTFRLGGSIRILSTQETNSTALTSALTGQGGRNVIQDESAIIMDGSYAMTWRMGGGHTKPDGTSDFFLMKIGNPFHNNHFKRTWFKDKDFRKILVDYHQGIREGRLSPSFVEKARTNLMFDILYECKFPDEDVLDEGGYRPMMTMEQLEAAFIEEDQVPDLIGRHRLGQDLAGDGNDTSVVIGRTDNVMRFYDQNTDPDTMFQVKNIEKFQALTGAMWSDIGVDITGLGKGVGDRLKEKGHKKVKCINFAMAAPDSSKIKDDNGKLVHQYKNMRAFMMIELRNWIVNGGKIVRHPIFYQLLMVKWRMDTSGKIQIQPKEEMKAAMKKAGLKAESYDGADAAALTFAGDTKPKAKMMAL
jgi:hypothetical protein